MNRKLHWRAEATQITDAGQETAKYWGIKIRLQRRSYLKRGTFLSQFWATMSGGH